MEKITIGIDVSKDRLDVAVRPSGENIAVPRTGAGLDDLVARLKVLKPNLIVLEATGGLETVVAAALAGAGLPVAVANPGQIRALLADLVARRRQIVEMIGAERQRENRANSRIKKSIGRLLKSLERELSSVDTDIDDAVRGSPAWREKEDLLSSVPSVGPAISRTLIAELPELGTLDRKEIAALVGLAPFARQSGQWRGKSFIGGGRTSVRKALFMGAMVAAQYNRC
jgi:transposase